MNHAPRLAVQSPVSYRRAQQEWCEEADYADHRHFSQLAADHRRVELRSRQEGEQHRAGGCQETEPLIVRAKPVEVAVMRGDGRHDDAHADLDEGDGDAQTIGDDGRDDRQGKPDGGDGERLQHDGALLGDGPLDAYVRCQEPSAPGGVQRGTPSPAEDGTRPGTHIQPSLRVHKARIAARRRAAGRERPAKRSRPPRPACSGLRPATRRRRRRAADRPARGSGPRPAARSRRASSGRAHRGSPGHPAARPRPRPRAVGGSPGARVR